GFTLSDVSLSPSLGTLGALVQDAGDPTIYRAPLTPAANVSGLLTVAVTGACTDVAGNAGTGNSVGLGGNTFAALAGNGNNNTLNGGNGTDTIDGLGGNDKVDGRNGNDWLFGGSGNDTLIGNNDNDWLFGEADDNTLNGGNGDDHLFGGS